VEDLCKIPVEQIQELDVIGIDEGQFVSDFKLTINSFMDYKQFLTVILKFKKDLLTYCSAWALHPMFYKRVIVAGLVTDAFLQGFNEMPELITVADSVTYFTAICSICKSDANTSHRKVKDTERELVGGKDQYDALCIPCYNEQTNNSFVINPYICKENEEITITQQ
jgi:thymidine kinase